MLGLHRRPPVIGWNYIARSAFSPQFQLIDIPFCGAKVRLFLRTESMPNTKSAERRMRNSARKHTRNSAVKSRLKTAEKGYLELLTAGKKDEAATALRQVTSYYDKAAKTGI